MPPLAEIHTATKSIGDSAVVLREIVNGRERNSTTPSAAASLWARLSAGWASFVSLIRFLRPKSVGKEEPESLAEEHPDESEVVPSEEAEELEIPQEVKAKIEEPPIPAKTAEEEAAILRRQNTEIANDALSELHRALSGGTVDEGKLLVAAKTLSRVARNVNHSQITVPPFEIGSTSWENFLRFVAYNENENSELLQCGLLMAYPKLADAIFDLSNQALYDDRNLALLCNLAKIEHSYYGRNYGSVFTNKLRRLAANGGNAKTFSLLLENFLNHEDANFRQAAYSYLPPEVLLANMKSISSILNSENAAVANDAWNYLLNSIENSESAITERAVEMLAELAANHNCAGRLVQLLSRLCSDNCFSQLFKIGEYIAENDRLAEIKGAIERERRTSEWNGTFSVLQKKYMAIAADDSSQRLIEKLLFPEKTPKAIGAAAASTVDERKVVEKPGGADERRKRIIGEMRKLAADGKGMEAIDRYILSADKDTRKTAIENLPSVLGNTLTFTMIADRLSALESTDGAQTNAIISAVVDHFGDNIDSIGTNAVTSGGNTYETLARAIVLSATEHNWAATLLRKPGVLQFILDIDIGSLGDIVDGDEEDVRKETEEWIGDSEREIAPGVGEKDLTEPLLDGQHQTFTRSLICAMAALNQGNPKEKIALTKKILRAIGYDPATENATPGARAAVTRIMGQIKGDSQAVKSWNSLMKECGVGQNEFFFPDAKRTISSAITGLGEGVRKFFN
jgi:hypothetical protein